MKKLTMKELLAKIEALEAKVAELEARPTEHHTHIHGPAYWTPPQPPSEPPYRITCNAQGAAG